MHNKTQLIELNINSNNKIDAFDTYNLKFRKKIIIINSEYNFAKNYINNLSLEYNSNKICVRINDSGKMIIPVHEIRLEEKLNTKISQIKPNKNDINMIYELFEDFKETKSMEIINGKYQSLNNSKAFKHFIKNYLYLNKDYSEIIEITNNDKDILKEYLLKLVIQNFFINPIKSKKTIEQIESYKKIF